MRYPSGPNRLGTSAGRRRPSSMLTSETHWMKECEVDLVRTACTIVPCSPCFACA